MSHRAYIFYHQHDDAPFDNQFRYLLYEANIRAKEKLDSIESTHLQYHTKVLLLTFRIKDAFEISVMTRDLTAKFRSHHRELTELASEPEFKNAYPNHQYLITIIDSFLPKKYYSGDFGTHKDYLERRINELFSIMETGYTLKKSARIESEMNTILREREMSIAAELERKQQASTPNSCNIC